MDIDQFGRFAMDKYERSNCLKNISDVSQVRGKDMAVMPLTGSHQKMTEKGGNFNNRNTTQQELGSKEMPKGMRSSSTESRVSAGFSNVVA